MKKNYICIMRKKNKEIKENKKQFEETLSHFHEKIFHHCIYMYIVSTLSDRENPQSRFHIKSTKVCIRNCNYNVLSL